MRFDWPKPVWTAFLTTCLFLMASSMASACLLCKLVDSSMSCSLEIGESGGGSCYINCRTGAAGEICFCRTLGVCGGSNGCDGQPCPTLVPKSELQSRVPGRTFLTQETLSALAATDPDMAEIVSGFVKDSDALQIGLISRAAFVPGEYKGTVTLAPSDG